MDKIAVISAAAKTVPNRPFLTIICDKLLSCGKSVPKCQNKESNFGLKKRPSK